MPQVWLPWVVAQRPDKDLKIATFNIGYNSAEENPADRMLYLHSQLLREGVEVAAIQELRHVGPRPELPYLEEQFRGWYIYRVPHNPQQQEESAILSRYPFVPGTEVVIPIHSRRGYQDRVVFSAVVRAPAGNIRVWTIHTRYNEPDWGTETTLRAAKALHDAEPNVPTIVMGDFNEGFEHIVEYAGAIGLQFSGYRASRIDHIIGIGITIRDEYQRPKALSSQHDPLFATAEVPG